MQRDYRRMLNISIYSMIKAQAHKSYLFAIALPLSILAVLLNKFGINFPYLDQWAYVPLHMKIDNGTFGIGDLWAQHNEHRIFFPKIAALTLSYSTHWYTPAEVVFSVFIALVGIILLARMISETARSSLQNFALVLIIASWFFSPIQWQNWLWGFQMAWFICITSVIATIYYLDKFADKNNFKFFWLAIICSTIATYSLGSGMLIWPIGFVLLLAYSLLKVTNRRVLYIWSGVGLLEFGAYYYGYIKPVYHPSVLLALHYPGSFLKYIATSLGRPFTNNVEVAYALGLIIVSLILCGIVLTIYYRKKVQVSIHS